jgi:hypothetical protein
VTPDSGTMFREYENGVADILGFLAEGTATIERNVHRAGHLSGQSRQIDVLLEGPIFGLTNATILVDCKRWNKRVALPAVEGFIGLVEDVGADIGFIISTKGASKSASVRASTARGIRVNILPLEELEAWRPVGTVYETMRIALSDTDEAHRVLRHAGFRLAVDTSFERGENENVIQAFRHYGTRHPDTDIQRDHIKKVADVLDTAGIGAQHIANGVGAGGGTPAYKHLPVLVDGNAVGLKVLVSSESEIEEMLQTLADARGLDRRLLTVETPDEWPVTGLFGIGS